MMMIVMMNMTMVMIGPVATRTACSAAKTDEEGAEWGPETIVNVIILIVIMVIMSITQNR